MFGREVLDAFLAAHAVAVERSGRHETTRALAGRGLRFVFAGSALAELNLPAFGHLPVSQLPHDLEIRAFDSHFSAVPPPLRPWETMHRTRRFEMFGDRADGTYMTYTAEPAALTVWDAARKLAVHWSAAGPGYPVLARASPYHYILCWWADACGAVVLHSAAVGENGDGILLGGLTGSGKTSTALACLADGLSYGGDDAIWCEPDRAAPSATSAMIGWPLYATARVFPHVLEQLPALRAALSPDTGGDKRVLFLAPRFGGQIEPLRIAAVHLPHVDRWEPETSVFPASQSEAFRALAPASLEFHPHQSRRTVQALMHLIATLPAFHLYLANERSPARRVRSILARLPTRGP